MKKKIKEISNYQILYRCSRTGIAWVEDYSTGTAHSAHPNIDGTGSVRGMKRLGYWRELDRTVRTRGTIYNIDSCVVTDELDEIARQHCRCGGKH